MRSFLLLLHLLAVYAQNELVDKSLPDSETYLTREDFELAKLEPEDENAPVDHSEMYHKERFEGDIEVLSSADLPSENMDPSIGGKSGRGVMGVLRNAARHPHRWWKNGRVPYTVSSQYTAWGRAKIAEAIEEYNKYTCIRFVPKTDQDEDYVHILPYYGCSSIIGKVGGMQRLSLVQGCLHKGTIMHELMHAIGFYHEQSRTDRDGYVTIHWENIADGLSDQFKKYPVRVIDDLGTYYDYSSIMHYPRNAFSRNGRDTIEPKQPGVEIGQVRGFSQTDLYKINRLYNCSITGPGPRPTQIPIPTVQPTQECVDRLDSCPMLSLYGQCYLKFSSPFMNRNCPRTCGKCSD